MPYILTCSPPSELLLTVTASIQVLERLCDRLRFDGEAAAALHKQLYRQKLESIIDPKLAPKSAELLEGQTITGTHSSRQHVHQLEPSPAP